MSTNPNICCGICGYKFKVYSTIEKHYHDYEEYDETVYYPLESENAHLVHNYICDNCYKNIGDIIKNSLIGEAKNYVEKLDNRINETKSDYRQKLTNEIEDLYNDNNNVKQMLNFISSKEISDLTEDEINQIEEEFPFTIAKYYLKNAVEITKRNKYGVKKLYEWANEYNLNIKSYPSNVNRYSLVGKADFKKILLDCIIENITPKQLLEIIQS